MESYQSSDGKRSPIISYEIGEDYIIVRFIKGGIYTYTYNSAGENTIEAMKRLAEDQLGLDTFIARNKPPYEGKD